MFHATQTRQNTRNSGRLAIWRRQWCASSMGNRLTCQFNKICKIISSKWCFRIVDTFYERCMTVGPRCAPRDVDATKMQQKKEIYHTGLANCMYISDRIVYRPMLCPMGCLQHMYSSVAYSTKLGSDYISRKVQRQGAAVIF